MSGGAAGLAPPGAGVAAWQRLVGRWVLMPVSRRVWPAARVADELGRRWGVLEGLVSGIGGGDRERPVLIGPRLYLEDSSRCWSLAMVVDHLGRLQSVAAGVASSLAAGGAPDVSGGTAAVKPAPGVSWEAAVEGYRDSLEAVGVAAGAVGASGSRSVAAHPWFGALDGGGWLSFLVSHHRVHEGQARAIVRGL